MRGLSASPADAVPSSGDWLSAMGRDWLSFDVRLVEEGVLLRVRELPQPEQEAFRLERDKIYEIPDGEARQAAFGAFHGRWFQRLELSVPFHRTLAEQVSFLGRTAACRVYLVTRRADEHADLLVQAGGRPEEGAIVVRLRATALLDPDRLTAFLWVEFRHIADMLDPAFGYEPNLPASDLGPAIDNLLRARYRVVWGTTVGGRLSRLAGPESRGRAAETAGVSREEFQRMFHWLGAVAADAAFRRWFEEDHPTHQSILAFARGPREPSGLTRAEPEARGAVLRG